MIFTVQDKYEEKTKYICSFTTKASAEQMVRDLEDQDRADNAYEPDKYIVMRRGLCYSDYGMSCGYNRNCICMLDEPYENCPARKKKAAGSADPGDRQQYLSPAN
ncbi:MAG: hypothetical protein IJ106_10385 [Parasporobacterium sp.]|nr:hypothetical protein [Parasporobacterium sp.]